MQKLAVALAGAVIAGMALSGGAQASPAGAAIGDAAATLSIVDNVQYVYGGRAHCWYGSGWKGPGWYQCGYRWRRGYGWGGPVGWNGWAAPGVVVAAPGVVVRTPGVVVAPGRYYWRGRYYANRRMRGGAWVYW